jgi:hypothetical protein
VPTSIILAVVPQERVLLTVGGAADPDDLTPIVEAVGTAAGAAEVR